MPASSTVDRKRRREGAATEPAPATSLVLQHPGSRRQKEIRVGFAWDIFFLAPVFGIPLFLRRLPQWGAVMLGLWVATLLVERLTPGSAHSIAQAGLFLAFLAVGLWLGLNGNAMTARSFIAHGWTVQNSEDEGQQQLAERWRIGR